MWWRPAFTFLLLVLPGWCFAQVESATIRASSQGLAKSSATEPLEHFKARVEKASQGKLKVEIFDSAKLYGDAEIVQAVSSGAVELAFVNLSRFAERIPALDLFQQPFLFTSDSVAAAARKPESDIRRLIDQAIYNEFKVRVLWWQPRGQTVFLSKGFSVANPEDLKGKKVRSFGPTIDAVISLCGGQPVKIGGEDQADAYEKGRVDVGMAGISTVMARSLWKPMGTITRTNHASSEFVNVINDKFWRSLTRAQQDIILAAARETDAESAEQNARIEATAYDELAKAGAIKIFDLKDDELVHWRVCSSDVLTTYVEKSGDLAHELMVRYGRLLESMPKKAAARSN